MGTSRYLKEQSRTVQIVGVQPDGESSIPGIRKWSEPYLPKIYDARRVDRIIEVAAGDAEEMTRRLGREEGIFAGVSSGGACCAALAVDAQCEGATIVFIVCDRGDRYLSSGVFPAA
jgi:cysteine synthase B